MNKTRKMLLPILSVLGLAMAAGAAPAGNWSVTGLAAALDTPTRPQADRDRDAARKPAQVMVFAGIEPGMTVLDVMAASGWYTEVLSVAVGPEGTVYAQNLQTMLEFRDGAIDKGLAARLAGNRLPNVVRADGGLSEADIEPGSVDLAFTALNLHDTYNFRGAEAVTAVLQDINRLLKPGGVLVLIDHAGNPDQDNTRLHRIEKQIVLDLVTGAGFVVEGDSDLLAHPEDDRTQMVFSSIRGKTDRFLLKLRKPG